MGLQAKKPSYAVKSFQCPNILRAEMKYLVDKGYFLNMSELIRFSIQWVIRMIHEDMKQEDLNNE